MELHPLLLRQIKRVGDMDPGLPPSAEAWAALCQHVSRAYEEHDLERSLLERSQALASQEMTTLNCRLRDERERAEAASRSKTRFLANMSHELRTPLNAVIGAAQLLRAGDDDADEREQMVAAIQRSGTNLLGLVENILDLSRIEAGELQLSRHDFHLVDCLEAALTTAGLAARAKGLQLACVVAPELAAWRHGDATLLRQVLLNLLGNAVKFTPAGEIVVRVDRGTGEDAVRISVTDTGIGIGPASLPQVFEPFRQADDGAQRRFGGSGLGLAIVRQLVQAMGGQIEVRSTLGVGSCFEFVLPLPAGQEAAEAAPAWGHRVAFFEPHEASAGALHALLTRMGCAVQRCQDARELRAWCLQEAPGPQPAWLLVSSDDWQTPELLEQVAELVDPEHLIGMSSIESYDAEKARVRCRMPRSVSKPVLRSALASRFVSTAGTRAATAARAAAPVLLTEQQLQAITHVLVVEDDALNQTIVCRLLRHAGYRVSAADDGHAALAAMRERPCDVVLMDWQMPGMDGLEVTRRMRAGEAGAAAQTVPIIALTANAFAEDRDACLAAGMNDFLTKPVLASSLKATIERWTRPDADPAPSKAAPARKPTPQPRPLAPHPAASPDRPDQPVFDPKVLATLPMVADGSEPNYGAEVLAMFLESVPQTLALIRQAMTGGDGGTVQRIVHTMKSSSAAVGALALAEFAERAETQLRAGQTLAALPDLPELLLHEFERLRAELASSQHRQPQDTGLIC